jgi:hypothetical protein
MFIILSIQYNYGKLKKPYAYVKETCYATLYQHGLASELGNFIYHKTMENIVIEASPYG